MKTLTPSLLEEILNSGNHTLEMRERGVMFLDGVQIQVTEPIEDQE